MTPALERLLALMAAGRADENRVVTAYTDFLRDARLDHFTLGFIEGLNGAPPKLAKVWTSLPDAWMEEYYARDFPVRDYVLHQIGAMNESRPLTTFDWGLHMADQSHAVNARPVLKGAADAGLGAAVSFVGRHVEDGRDRRFAASFGCSSAPIEETRRRIDACRNELVIASFAMAPLLAPALDESTAFDATSDACILTGRERDVLARFAQGLRPDRIAERMGLSKRTIDMHAANVRRKLGARTLAEAVAKGIRRDLI